MARLQEMATVRRVAALKGKLQRMNPVEAPDEYMKAFGSWWPSSSRRGRCASARWAG